MKDIHKFLKTDDQDFGLLIARLALGIVMLPHGLQKTLGWFGGGGFNATMGMMQEMFGLPAFIVFLVIIAESIGAIALILGFWSRFCALSLAVIIAYAALVVHSSNGFFMNWMGAQAGEGIEFHILYVALGLIVMIGGGGAWSLDAIMSKKK